MIRDFVVIEHLLEGVLSWRNMTAGRPGHRRSSFVGMSCPMTVGPPAVMVSPLRRYEDNMSAITATQDRFSATEGKLSPYGIGCRVGMVKVVLQCRGCCIRVAGADRAEDAAVFGLQTIRDLGPRT